MKKPSAASASPRQGCLGYILPFATFDADSGPTGKPPRSGCTGSIIAILVTALLFSIAGWVKMKEQGDRMKQADHGRQLYLALISWAVDHEGYLPDHGLGEHATANQAFRRLFQDQILADETIFGGIRSPYVADKKIGSAPGFAQAVEAGENHWMLVGGLSLDSPGPTPLFFENAMTSAWPPVWKGGWIMPEERGRSWHGKIMVYHLDGSQSMEVLDARHQSLILPTSAYPAEWQTSPPRILDIQDAR